MEAGAIYIMDRACGFRATLQYPSVRSVFVTRAETSTLSSSTSPVDKTTGVRAKPDHRCGYREGLPRRLHPGLLRRRNNKRLVTTITSNARVVIAQLYKCRGVELSSWIKQHPASRSLRHDRER